MDDAVYELGTAYHVAGRGLVVIGSCSHRGIINTVRCTQAVSGIDRVHAIVGGFHLVPPQTKQQLFETVAMMQSISPDYVIPGHCSGDLFIAAASQAMPDKIIRSVAGSSYRFGLRALLAAATQNSFDLHLCACRCGRGNSPYIFASKELPDDGFTSHQPR